MNETPLSDALLWEALPELTLNIAQTAALCGISVRQLGYWTRQGYVDAQGHGARRTYGLEAVRRILTIRKAMDGGASLRQSLRLLAAPISASPPSRPTSLPALSLPVSSLPTIEVQILSQSLRTLFERNRETRDHAGGLAVKLGRAEDDVRQAAEGLCEVGVLTKSVCQGMTIFHQIGREVSYA
jgi:DNA-binding transcriptional MerR regulator